MLDSISTTILRLFAEFGQEELDLHTLFEAGGNDPAKREAVVDGVARLVRQELLEERGNDFYALTEKGKRMAAGGGIRR